MQIRCVGVLSFSLLSLRLTGKVKLTDFGAASPTAGLSKEDERSTALAARAQNGDYDDGMI